MIPQYCTAHPVLPIITRNWQQIIMAAFLAGKLAQEKSGRFGKAWLGKRDGNLRQRRKRKLSENVEIVESAKTSVISLKREWWPIIFFFETMLGGEHSGRVSKKLIGNCFFWGITLTEGTGYETRQTSEEEIAVRSRDNDNAQPFQDGVGRNVPINYGLLPYPTLRASLF